MSHLPKCADNHHSKNVSSTNSYRIILRHTNINRHTNHITKQERFLIQLNARAFCESMCREAFARIKYTLTVRVPRFYSFVARPYEHAACHVFFFHWPNTVVYACWNRAEKTIILLCALCQTSVHHFRLCYSVSLSLVWQRSNIFSQCAVYCFVARHRA